VGISTQQATQERVEIPNSETLHRLAVEAGKYLDLSFGGRQRQLPPLRDPTASHRSVTAQD
jgi:hypothetical protein